VYGFLTRDGIDPTRFREIARRELSRYRNVKMLNAESDASAKNCGWKL
jgi:hypothetical protein